MEGCENCAGGVSDKSIHYRGLDVLTTMPKKQEPFTFMDAHYRLFCKPWWMYWLNPRSYTRAIGRYWNRARYGWDKEDCYSLDDYLAQWMPYAVSFTTWHINHYTQQSEKDKKKLYYMCVGWEALWHLGWSCECYAERIAGLSHDEYWQKRFAFCMPYFEQYMRRLWW